MMTRKIAGFYTEEIRESRQRKGFRVKTLSGEEDVLSHVEIRSRHRVGRYGVDAAAFERLVLPALTRTCDLFLIDEIGKMECFSNGFQDAVRNVLGGDAPVIATVGASGSGFIAEVKARKDVQIWEVTKADRDDLPQRLADRLAESM